MSDRAALDAALVTAHEIRDAAQIAALYAKAGDLEDSRDAACFFWTQGYIWALEAGSPIAGELHEKLRAEGREA